EPDCVQVHVLHIPNLLDFALSRWTKKHVRRPAAATDEDRPAVDLEHAIALRIQFGSHLPDAEMNQITVGSLVVHHHLQFQSIQVLRPDVHRPPEPRNLYDLK